MRLFKAVTKTDNRFGHYDFVAESKKLATVMGDKHMTMVAKNDKFLNRRTEFAIDYGDGQAFAPFSPMLA